jgi:hypothetical protein
MIERRYNSLLPVGDDNACTRRESLRATDMTVLVHEYVRFVRRLYAKTARLKMIAGYHLSLKSLRNVNASI